MDTTPTPPPGTPPMHAVAVAEDKTVAILSYITVIGFIAAIIVHMNKKTQLGAFHLRQMLGLLLTSLVGVIPFLGWLVLVCVLVLWIMGLISAIKGEMKPVPLVGPFYQKWFAGAFN